jgi:hypothetical protein
MSEIAAPPPAARTPRGRVVLAVAALAILVAGSAFGTYALTRSEPRHVDSIGCYGSASANADVTVIGNTAGDPVDACAELWRRGDMAPGVTTAPPLQACVLETGAVAVIPSGEAGSCNAIGAARLSAEGRRELRLLGGLHAALVERLGVGSGSRPRGDCVGEARARAIGRQELAARGLDGWQVRLHGEFGPDRPCASPSLDRAGRAVVLVPVPR